MNLSAFLDRWRGAGAAERANKDSFLVELCAVLEVPAPDPKTNDPERDLYVFEKEVVRPHEEGSSLGKIDLYRVGCFVLEAKQAKPEKRESPAWHQAMNDAFGQALGYARNLPTPPPFVVVCDLGYCFDLYASFDGSGQYRPFPDGFKKRLFLADLEQHRATLRALWLDPLELDPSRRQAKVTREVAEKVAALARELEASKQASSETVARFLMRCLFTMFAEDVDLLKDEPFTKFLKESWLPNPKSFPNGIASLWRAMNEGGDTLLGRVLRFNGGLFRDTTALSLTPKQLALLLDAAESNWSEVDPSIFGTLLERALSPEERHRLGAHYTPRAYVERLVKPTIEEPLRADWDLVRAEVRALVEADKPKAAQERVLDFHHRLCKTRVLDPACGTGNFLYVTLDLFKRLESEVLALLAGLGYDQLNLEMEQWSVTPEQFRGIEVKPWAKEIAELVLWIGYLQWQVRQSGEATTIAEPVLKDFQNIECRDAVLAWDGEPELARDDHGKPITRWDGQSMKVSPVTGEEIPDDSKTIPLFTYKNPRRAEWPKADFIVGNPPYIGNKRMRLALGDGYVEALRAAHDDVPETADLVMYWWNHAANLVRAKQAQRFGLITTNSITQTFNRKVVERLLRGKDEFSIVFAIPDHPWVDSVDGAAVRVAMTTCTYQASAGLLMESVSESPNEDGEVSVSFSATRGAIRAQLTVGSDVFSTIRLEANSRLAGQGVIVLGEGFVVEPDQLKQLLKLEPRAKSIIKRYRNGKDITHISRELWIIDLFGFSEADLANVPVIRQRLLERVRPFRLQMKDRARRERWWLFGRSNEEVRRAISGLQRYIATCRTSKHRTFQFLDGDVLPDAKIVAIGLPNPDALCILSSRIHELWAKQTGAFLGVGNDSNYNHSDCFGTFPFPSPSMKVVASLRSLGEQLDSHRKARQAEYPGLTITGMYNVLEKLRSGETLTAKEKTIHEQGLVSVLKQLHDEIDAATFEAYGWPATLTDEEILKRLVALNHERAEEEKRGVIRWLRPEFQNPSGVKAATQGDLLEGETVPAAAAKGKKGKTTKQGKDAEKGETKRVWPKELPAQVAAVRDLLAERGTLHLASAREAFKGARAEPLAATLDSLAALGLAVASGVGEARAWSPVR